MVSNEERLNRLFHALADPTRRALVARLTKGSARLVDLTEPFQMTRAAVSKHLGVLEEAGLVKRVRVGRETRCTLDARSLHRVEDWARRYRLFWREQLDRLGDYLERESE